MHRAEDLGIRVVISDKALRQNNQNTKKALVCSLPALGQSHDFTASWKLQTATSCTKQFIVQQAEKTWSCSLIPWTAARTHIWLEMRLKHVISTTGGKGKAILEVNTLLPGTQAPPELCLLITPWIRTILGSQNTLRKNYIKVSKQTHSPVPRACWDSPQSSAGAGDVLPPYPLSRGWGAWGDPCWLEAGQDYSNLHKRACGKTLRIFQSILNTWKILFIEYGLYWRLFRGIEVTLKEKSSPHSQRAQGWLRMWIWELLMLFS